MVKLTAMVEQAGDGSWTAAVVGEHSVLGTGATKDEALADLRRGVAGLIEYLKAQGEALPQSAIELVNIEVAA
jgi:predicted RNase H-like HicB family nuclease